MKNAKWPLSVALVAAFLASGVEAHAQRSTKYPRIGYLTGASLSANSARHEAFRQGLRDLGYIEGKNIDIDWRSAEEKLDRLHALAAEFVRLEVNVIVTGGSSPTRAAKEATTKIPVVMAQDSDPVGNGFVASLARPGGNITGLSTLAPELNGKRLELLQEIVPRLSRVAVLGTSTSPSFAQRLREVEIAAKSLGVKLQYLDILSSKDIAIAFQAATKGRADAVLIMVAGRVASSERTQIADRAVKSRLPAIYDRSGFVEQGGLMTYGVNFYDLDRRAATYVDKILKGAKPAEIPVEQPVKFEFIVNLKAAKQIGLTIPPNVLVRAARSLNDSGRESVIRCPLKNGSDHYEVEISFLVTDHCLAHYYPRCSRPADR